MICEKHLLYAGEDDMFLLIHKIWKLEKKAAISASEHLSLCRKICENMPSSAEVVYLCYMICSRLLMVSFPNKSKRKVQGVPQSQTAALPRPQEEEETDKSK